MRERLGGAGEAARGRLALLAVLAIVIGGLGVGGLAAAERPAARKGAVSTSPAPKLVHAQAYGVRSGIAVDLLANRRAHATITVLRGRARVGRPRTVRIAGTAPTTVTLRVPRTALSRTKALRVRVVLRPGGRAKVLRVVSRAAPTSVAAPSARQPAPADPAGPPPSSGASPAPPPASGGSTSPGPTSSAPVATSALPTVGGTVALGQQLVADPGIWTGVPRPTLAYQWMQLAPGADAFSAIPGATQTTFTIPSSGVTGTRYRLRVSATNVAGTAVADSAATQAVPAVAPGFGAPPAVSGTPVVGGALTAVPGTVAGDPVPAISYRWQRSSGGDFADIPDADEPNYDVTGADYGARLRVVATATNDAGSAEAESTSTSVVPPVAPAFSGTPAISGSPAQGGQVSAVVGDGDITGTPAPTVSYQWFRVPAGGDPVAIVGATAATLSIPDDAVDEALRVEVTATNPGGTASASATTPGTVVATAPTVAGSPSATIAAAGPSAPPPYLGTFAASAAGAFTSAVTPTYAYRWQFLPASGGSAWQQLQANGTTYVPTCAQVGGQVRAEVSATNSGGTVTAYTNALTIADVDTDQDGITNCVEIGGFALPLYQGTSATPTSTRQVASDPLTPDTDQDGLPDGAEWPQGAGGQGGLSTAGDPSSPDTDGDGLTYTLDSDEQGQTCGQASGTGPCSSDWSEVNAYGTGVANQDTDGDASGPQGYRAELEDGPEVTRLGTSPTLVDSDGDAGYNLGTGSLTDYLEVTAGGEYNPVVAQLPQISITQIEPLTLQLSTLSQSGTTGQTQTTLTDGESNAIGNAQTHTTALSQSHSLTEQISVGYSTSKGWSAKSVTTYGYQWQQATTNSSTSNASQQTNSQNQKTYQQAQSQNTTWEPTSTVSTVYELTNNGQVSVELENPSFVVTATDLTEVTGQGAPTNPQQVLGTLTAPSGSLIDCPAVFIDQNCTSSIPPGGSIELEVTSSQVNTQALRDYMQSPSTLTATLANVKYWCAACTVGQDFNGAIGQAVSDQDVPVLIDFSGARTDGGPQLVQAVVSTQRAVDLSGDKWVTVGDVLDTLDLDYTEQPGPGGVQAVASVQGVESVGRQGGAWVLFGNAEGMSGSDQLDFSDIRLEPGTPIQLTFSRDSDLDGLWDQEEAAIGTDASLKDTDGDGLSDYLEVRKGDSVPMPAPNGSSTGALSSPLSCDGDQDGSPDGWGAGTDAAPCPPLQDPDLLPEYVRVTCQASVTPNDPSCANPPPAIPDYEPDNADDPANRPTPTQGTDPLDADTNDDGLEDGVEAYPDVLAPCPNGPDICRVISSGGWTGGRLVTSGGQVVDGTSLQLSQAGQTASTPPTPVCGTADTRTKCAGASGYYRVSWTMTVPEGSLPASGTQADPVLGSWTVQSAGTGVASQSEPTTLTWLQAQLAASEVAARGGTGVEGTYELYLHMTGEPDDVTFQYAQGQYGPITITGVTLQPITEQQFLGAPQGAGGSGANAAFAALAMPAQDLVQVAGASSDGDQAVRIDQPVAGQPGFGTVLWGPGQGLGLPAGGYRAGFTVRVQDTTVPSGQSDDTPIISPGVTAGPTTLSTPDALIPGSGGAFASAGDSSRKALVYGPLYRTDVPSPGAAYTAETLFEQSAPVSNLSLPVAVAGDAGESWLESVVIDVTPYLQGYLASGDGPANGMGFSGHSLHGSLTGPSGLAAVGSDQVQLPAWGPGAVYGYNDDAPVTDGATGLTTAWNGATHLQTASLPFSGRQGGWWVNAAPVVSDPPSCSALYNYRPATIEQWSAFGGSVDGADPVFQQPLPAKGVYATTSWPVASSPSSTALSLAAPEVQGCSAFIIDYTVYGNIPSATAVDVSQVGLTNRPPVGLGISVSGDAVSSQAVQVAVGGTTPAAATAAVAATPGAVLEVSADHTFRRVSRHAATRRSVRVRLAPGPDGRRTIHARLRTAKGIVRLAPVDLVLDRTAPRLRTGASSRRALTRRGRIVLRVADATSGVAQMRLRVNGRVGKWRPYRRVLPRPGGRLDVQVRDRAGNPSVWVPASS